VRYLYLLGKTPSPLQPSVLETYFYVEVTSVSFGAVAVASSNLTSHTPKKYLIETTIQSMEIRWPSGISESR
jgi:hypothetical protein